MKNKKLQVALATILLIISITTTVIIYYNASLKPLKKNGEEELVEILSGYSLPKISKILKESDIIRNSLTFQIHVKMVGAGNRLKAGKYLLSSSYSVDQILNVITDGKVVDESTLVTFPEGWTLKQMAEELEKQKIISKQEDFIKEAKDIEKYQKNFSFLTSIKNKTERTLEGYLFPDTYYFDKEDDSEDIMRKMLKRFGEVYIDEYTNQGQSIGMSIDDIVILSSMVEQETKYDVDRPRVAGVFYNRLEKGIPLQSDITILYAMGIKKEQVLYKDLQIDSKYNTYKYKGLPIGPIGSFGVPTLKATLYPEDNKYYYFIAKPDGYCVFNETFKEHTVDVKKYLR